MGREEAGRAMSSVRPPNFPWAPLNSGSPWISAPASKGGGWGSRYSSEGPWETRRGQVVVLEGLQKESGVRPNVKRREPLTRGR